MKTIAFGIAALLIGTTAALADEPAKTMDSSAGKIYTDAKGMTLYTFDKDAAGKSNCDGDCAANGHPSWQPLTRRPRVNGPSSTAATDRKCGPTKASRFIPMSMTRKRETLRATAKAACGTSPKRIERFSV